MLSSTPQALPLLAVLVVTAIAAVTDLRHGVIPNRLTLCAFVVAVVGHAWWGGWAGFGFAWLGAGACAVVPLLLFVRGGMGGGDVKLLAAIGAMVGTMQGLRIQLYAYLLAGFYSCGCLAYRGRLFSTIGSALRLLWPAAWSRGRPSMSVADELAQTVRLGGVIAVASVLVAAERQIATAFRLP